MVRNFCRFNLGLYESEVIKMCNVKKILAAMLMVFAVTILGNAEAAIVTDKMPLQCYVDHKVTSYDTRSGQAVGWIDAEVDLVKIRGIDGNGVAIGTHPGRNGTVERLFWARDVFADTNYSNRNAHVSGYHDVYRTSTSGSTIGSVRDEDVTVVADNGNRAQIIYRLDNGTGYKMGWVPSSIVSANDNRSNFQMEGYNLTSPSDHQLRFTGRLWNANNYSEITGVHVYIGGGVGAGGEFIGEFRADRDNHHFDYTMNVPQNRSGSQLVVIYAVNGKDAAELDRRYVNISGGSQPTTGAQRSPSGLIYPLGSRHRLVGANDRNNGKNHDHTLDCCSNAGLGTKVYAITDGEVRYYSIIGYTPKHQNQKVLISYGNVAYFVGDNGFGAVYAHLSALEGYSTPYGGNSNYPAFQDQCWGIERHNIGSRRVRAGDIIGYIGESGNAKGVHLHFELYKNAYFTANGKVSGTRLEPNNYFNQ